MLDRRILVAGVLLVAACGRGRSSAPAPLEQAAAVPNVRLVAMLQPFGSPVAGEARLAPGRTAQEMQATVKIRNSVVGLQHRWQIRRGSCDSPLGEDIAPASANAPLSVRADGTAEASITLPVALPVDSDYNVRILRSRSDDTVIACGMLGIER